MTKTDASRLAGEWQARFDNVLDRHLPPEDAEPCELHRAMRYAALGIGKRFRPVLTYASGHALAVPQPDLDPIAAAIELIHLAGDALPALAFEVLAAELPAERASSLEIVLTVAAACGSTGMAGGQALDLAAVGHTLSEADLNTMHRLKTGALIRAAVEAPCILAGTDRTVRENLSGYGDCVGLAFQVHDDILDITGSSERIGKSTQADAALDKPTFPSILGLDASRLVARDLRDRAIAHLDAVPGDTTVLAWLADYVIHRDH
ncbi:MAG: polyprenyl synthetase family protein [Woeseiaceae bacterium]